MIEVAGLTVKYPNGKGVFDLNFRVGEGEVMGYLGPNGAGKTTTIRALLGFMAPNEGSCSINGLDCTKDAPRIQNMLGYIPGEISFLDGMRGDEFLKFISDMRGTKDLTNQKRLIDMFELDTKGKIKKYSKGMKQKVGIVAAFMHNPDVLILDEPTSGLDPLMQNRFIELVLEEKAKGKTILMSSHIFEETQKTCDNISIIKDGVIVEQSDVIGLKSRQRKVFVVTPKDMEVACDVIVKSGFELNNSAKDSIEVSVSGDDVDALIKTLAGIKLINLEIKSQSLEDIFMQFYAKGGK